MLTLNKMLWDRVKNAAAALLSSKANAIEKKPPSDSFSVHSIDADVIDSNAELKTRRRLKYGDEIYEMPDTLAKNRSELLAHLRNFHDLKNSAPLEFLLDKQGEALQVATKHLRELDPLELLGLANVVQECIAHGKSECKFTTKLSAPRLRLLQDLCDTASGLPTSYRISDVVIGDKIASGGEAEVYSGNYNGCVVVIRKYLSPTTTHWETPKGHRDLKLIIREAVSHWQLRHENIVTFLGVFYDPSDSASPPSMVLRRAKYSSALEYVKICDDTGSFLKIIRGIASGLAYLHSRVPPVVHGDLHLQNVLVDIHNDSNPEQGIHDRGKGVALLCDFGLSRIRHEITRTNTASNSGGVLRFLAPEICTHDSRITQASDIYSFAMVIYNLATFIEPFYPLPHLLVFGAVQAGRRPEPPSPLRLGGLEYQPSQLLWDLMGKMWGGDENGRPSITQFSDEFEKAITTQDNNTVVQVDDTLASTEKPPIPAASNSRSPDPTRCFYSTTPFLPGDILFVPTRYMERYPNAAQLPLKLGNIAAFLGGTDEDSQLYARNPHIKHVARTFSHNNGTKRYTFKGSMLQNRQYEIAGHHFLTQTRGYKAFNLYCGVVPMLAQYFGVRADQLILVKTVYKTVVPSLEYTLDGDPPEIYLFVPHGLRSMPYWATHRELRSDAAQPLPPPGAYVQEEENGYKHCCEPRIFMMLYSYAEPRQITENTAPIPNDIEAPGGVLYDKDSDYQKLLEARRRAAGDRAPEPPLPREGGVSCDEYDE